MSTKGPLPQVAPWTPSPRYRHCLPTLRLLPGSHGVRGPHFPHWRITSGRVSDALAAPVLAAALVLAQRRPPPLSLPRTLSARRCPLFPKTWPSLMPATSCASRTAASAMAVVVLVLLLPTKSMMTPTMPAAALAQAHCLFCQPPAPRKWVDMPTCCLLALGRPNNNNNNRKSSKNSNNNSNHSRSPPQPNNNRQGKSTHPQTTQPQTIQQQHQQKLLPLMPPPHRRRRRRRRQQQALRAAATASTRAEDEAAERRCPSRARARAPRELRRRPKSPSQRPPPERRL
mmetsp:Transcript_39225/g.83535  ORF Transcript_39225/g.83535 Transcript_39225/m.83535 type:complete len:286 (-) Transcript_39225:13-870(-)